MTEAGTAPSVNTCRPITGSLPSGVQKGSNAGQLKSGRRPPCSPRPLVQRAYPQQAYRTLLGILRLAKVYGEPRLESACERALHFNTLSYRSIESILENGLDRRPLTARADTSKPVQHSNIRGADYYTSTIH